jgi:uncharacterized protein
MNFISISRNVIAASLVFLFACASLAARADEGNVDVSTPAITVIKKSIAQRFAHLKPHLDAGVIGLTHDGLVAIRDHGNLSVLDRGKLESHVAEENKDRGALYREIARANGHPDWETDLKLTFGARWISRAQQGWYYRDSAGKWQQKP